MGAGISVVVPMYNEEENVEKAVRSLLDVLPTLTDDSEILIVESGSTDRTAEIADRLADEHPSVRVIHQINREGLGSAIRLGFANARKEIVLYIDGDEPFDVRGISRAVPLLAECDAVIGYRIGKRENLKRILFSKVYNSIIQFFFGLGVRDVNFSMKIFHRRLLRVLDLRANGVFYDAELLAEFRRNGASISEIGFEYVPRKSGESSLDTVPIVVETLFEMVKYLLRRKRRSRPASENAS